MQRYGAAATILSQVCRLLHVFCLAPVLHCQNSWYLGSKDMALEEEDNLEAKMRHRQRGKLSASTN
jgi:hypothetical protein